MHASHPSIFHPENSSLPGFAMNNASFQKLERHSFDFPLCLAFSVIFEQGKVRTWNKYFINKFIWSSNSFLALISWYLKYFFLSKESSGIVFIRKWSTLDSFQSEWQFKSNTCLCFRTKGFTGILFFCLYFHFSAKKVQKRKLTFNTPGLFGD